VNLTGARTPAERARLLVGEVLAAASIPDSGTLVDVGSGNGSPGLVFALLRDDLEATLLEPRARRWAFLREAARATGSAVGVLRARHDAFSGPPARTVTLRGLALPLADLAPLVEVGGRLLVFGGRPAAAGAFEETGEGAGAGVTVYRRLG
jgi:16S rRNA (guanine527-N7)-methyltransferase